MTNKIDEIKALINIEQIKLLGHNILTPYLANAVELLDQLDLKTEKDKLLIELGKYYRACNILLPNTHEYFLPIQELIKQISEMK